VVEKKEKTGYIDVSTSVWGLLEEERQELKARSVSPCETIPKGKTDQSVVPAFLFSMFCSY